MIVAPETVLGPVSLLSGDVNSDDAIDITDATLVGLNFGETDPEIFGETDITNDGIVDIFDIILVSINFGETEPTVWTCQ